MVEVSVVLPSKDEEEIIGTCIKKIRIVFVNHGIARAPDYLFTYQGFLFLVIGIVSLVSRMLNLNLGFTPRSWFVVAGNLSALTGYEIMFFGFFSKIYWGKELPEYFTLEKGASIGALAFAVGFIYLLILVSEWMYGGLTPSLEQAMIGFTAIVLGIQTFFSSFLLSVVAHGKKNALSY